MCFGVWYNGWKLHTSPISNKLVSYRTGEFQCLSLHVDQSVAENQLQV